MATTEGPCEACGRKTGTWPLHRECERPIRRSRGAAWDMAARMVNRPGPGWRLGPGASVDAIASMLWHRSEVERLQCWLWLNVSGDRFVDPPSFLRVYLVAPQRVERETATLF